MKGALVLVVDDESNIRDILVHFLEEEGYGTIATGDPEEALAMARELTPNVVLLDVMMPRMDGFDLCQMIHDHPDTRNVPVVFLTALGDDISRQVARVSGGKMHLQKPFTREDVLKAVRVALESV